MKRLLPPTVLFLVLAALLRAATTPAATGGGSPDIRPPATGNSSALARLQVGDTAPLVTATADDGKPLDLGELYKKNTYTLVYFYPKAFTGGCTKQGCALRDDFDELAKKGVAVVGVSIDDVETQRRFREENKFPFPLIADTDKKVQKAFGQPGLGAAAREAYLIKGGKIIYKDTNQTSSQAELVLNFLSRENGTPAAQPAVPPTK
jgi:peroxiredoxin Q/BCP